MRSGFKPGERGVSVSVSRKSAAALLRAAKRMNSFKNDDEVKGFLHQHGLSHETIEKTVKDRDQRVAMYRAGGNHDRADRRATPAGLYFHAQLNHHPAVGGDLQLPDNEFLWGDFAEKHIGKQMVAVFGDYEEQPHERDKIKTMQNYDGIEGEHLVTNHRALYPNGVAKYLPEESADSLIKSAVNEGYVRAAAVRVKGRHIFTGVDHAAAAQGAIDAGHFRDLDHYLDTRWHDAEEGFVDHQGRFLDRVQARVLAQKAGQMVQRPWDSEDELDSHQLKLDKRTVGESADSMINLMFLFEGFNVRINNPHKLYLKHDYTEPDRYATPTNPGFPEHGYNITHPEHGHIGLIVGDEEPNGRFNIRRVVLSGKYGGFADAKGALGVQGVMQVGRELRRFGHTHVYSNSRVSGVRSERGNSNVPDVKLPEQVSEEHTIPQGECFSWAYRRLQSHHARGEHDAALVHGTVRHPWSGKRYPHAWVEHKGHVYDWQSTQIGLGKQHTVKSFKELYQPVKTKRYTLDQARRAAVRKKHLGPWH